MSKLKDIQDALFYMEEVHDCCAFTFLDWKGNGKFGRFNNMPIGEKTKITVGDNINAVIETLTKLKEELEYDEIK